MRAQAPAIGRNYYYHIPDRLDVDAMKAAVRYIIGTHDFKAFQSSGGSQKSTVRTVYEASWELQSPDCLYFNIKGNGVFIQLWFVYLWVHLLKLEGLQNDSIRYEIYIGVRRTSQCGPTALPHGLCLEEVYY